MKTSFVWLHWLATMFLAALIVSGYEAVFNTGITADNLSSPYLVILAFSMFFSLPTLLICYIVHLVLIGRSVKPALAKLVLITLSVLGVITTLYLLLGNTLLAIYVIYGSVIIVAGKIIRIKRKGEPVR
jgi:hypothetical protein